MLLQTFMLVLNNVYITISSCMLSGLEPEIQKSHLQTQAGAEETPSSSWGRAPSGRREGRPTLRQADWGITTAVGERKRWTVPERERTGQAEVCTSLHTRICSQNTHLFIRDQTECSQMLENTNTFKLLKKGRLDKSDRGSWVDMISKRNAAFENIHLLGPGLENEKKM